MAFTWPARPSYASEDFVVAGANEAAAHFIATWPDGAPPAALLAGPPLSGKTHLASVWAARTGASFLPAEAVGRVSTAELWHGKKYAVLENIERISDEPALFHVLRHAETEGTFLLLTSREKAQALPFQLPDLQSRLRAMPSALIEAPDEPLLKAFLFKCFADRQMRIGEEAVDYLLRRTERSFEAGVTAVETIERYASEAKKPVTVPFLRSLQK